MASGMALRGTVISSPSLLGARSARDAVTERRFLGFTGGWSLGVREHAELGVALDLVLVALAFTFTDDVVRNALCRGICSQGVILQFEDEDLPLAIGMSELVTVDSIETFHNLGFLKEVDPFSYAADVVNVECPLSSVFALGRIVRNTDEVERLG